MNKVWHSKLLSKRLKRDIYRAAVISIATYGCECWVLNKKAMEKLRAWNCKRLVVLSGLGFREEYMTPTVDIVQLIRKQRLKWAGQVLRREDSYLPRRILIGEWKELQAPRDGGLLVDAPRMDIEGLIMLAKDIETWKLIEIRA